MDRIAHPLDEPVQELLKAMGIDTKRTDKVELIFTPDDYVHANVRIKLYDSEIKEMVQVAQKHRMILEEVPETKEQE